MCFSFSALLRRKKSQSSHQLSYLAAAEKEHQPAIIRATVQATPLISARTPYKRPSRENTARIPVRRPHWEPPVFDYNKFTVWEKVQKENFIIGGPDLPYKTSVVDLRIEKNLLGDYWIWANKQAEDSSKTKEEHEFLEGLREEIEIDDVDVWEELNENDGRFGKTEVDHRAILNQARGLYLREMGLKGDLG